MTEANSLASVRLYNEIFQSIEVFGLNRTIEILYSARAEALRLEDENTVAVLTIVCREFQLNVYELLYGRGRKNDRIIAIGLCVHYLKNEFNYRVGDITAALRRDRTSCWRNLKAVIDLNDKSVADKKYIEIKQKCNTEVDKFKLSKIQVH